MVRTFRTSRSRLVSFLILALIALAGPPTTVVRADARDCSEADHPPFGTAIDLPSPLYSVVVDGDRAYVMREVCILWWGGCYQVGTLSVYDLSPPEPTELGSYGLFDGSAFDVEGGFAYVAGHDQFHVVDVSDPAALHGVENYSLGWPVVPECIAVVGGYAYVGDATGLLVVDVADPASPSLVASLAFPAKAVSVALAGSFAYVGTLDARVAVVDVSNPLAPAVVATVALPDTPWDIKVKGSRAYVSDGDAGLQILDVSRPAQPRLVGGVDTPGEARLVALSGARAYVVDRRPSGWDSGLNVTDLQVIDISNPTRPVIVNSIAGVDSRDDVSGYWVSTALGSVAANKECVVVGGTVTHSPDGCAAVFPYDCGIHTSYVNLTPRSAYEPAPPCSGRPAGTASSFSATALTSDTSTPTAFALRRNDPNPFNPETSIRFDVPRASSVRVQVYDARGRLVKTLVDDALPAGRHAVSWRGRSESGEAVSSGIYFVTMEAETFRQTRKITLLK